MTANIGQNLYLTTRSLFLKLHVVYFANAANKIIAGFKLRVI